MTVLDRTQAALVLNALPNIGPASVQKLRQNFDGDLAAALAAPLEQIIDCGIKNKNAEIIANWRAFFSLEKEEEALNALGARFIDFDDEHYPKTLRERPEIAPAGLYVRGNVDALRLTARKSVSFIGTRKSTLYGNRQATAFAESIAARGWSVVSGLAEGIDAAAHVGALNAEGCTVAVIGTGIDICYPAKNRELFERIAASDGAVISEFPIGKHADKQSFPIRNRIVAAISTGTFIVESDIRGGSMITADYALNYGKTLFALPGRIDVPASAGCHRLIRDGAILVTSPDDICNELDGFGASGALHFDFGEDLKNKIDKNAARAAAISSEAGQIFRLLSEGDKLTMDDLIEKSGLSAPDVMAATMLLELEQLVVKYADGNYEIN